MDRIMMGTGLYQGRNLRSERRNQKNTECILMSNAHVHALLHGASVSMRASHRSPSRSSRQSLLLPDPILSDPRPSTPTSGMLSPVMALNVKDVFHHLEFIRAIDLLVFIGPSLTRAPRRENVEVSLRPWL